MRRAGGPRRRRPAHQRARRDRGRSQAHEFYDFEAKYLDEADVRLTCPADLPPEVVRPRSAELAAAAFEALGCEGLARVDFFCTDDGEVRRQRDQHDAGLHPASRCTRGCGRRPGLDYPALIDRLVQLALRRRTGLR